jgi:Rrf2 family transcriptional regulator, iron-sulfur cluster assembly transcription factor
MLLVEELKSLMSFIHKCRRTGSGQLMTGIMCGIDRRQPRERPLLVYLCTMFSKTFGHAVRATTYVALHGNDGHKVALQELSANLEIPHYFLGKIMQDLVRHGVVDSTKGPNGGFFTNPNTAGLPLIELLKITDGSVALEQCALGLKRCNPAHPCLLHYDFAICRDGMLKILAIKTVHDLTQSTAGMEVFLV